MKVFVLKNNLYKHCGDDNPIPQKVIKIDGCVEVPPTVTEDEIMDKFIKFVEANHWHFGGGVQEFEDLP